jgi:hypothetical protein
VVSEPLTVHNFKSTMKNNSEKVNENAETNLSFNFVAVEIEKIAENYVNIN